MPEQNPVAMPATADRPVRLDDVAAVYVVYLGRRSEDIEGHTDWLGLKLSDLVGAFTTSPEFRNVAHSLIKTGRLVGGNALTPADLASADRWLANVSPGHEPSAQAEWADVLLAALTSPELGQMASPDFDPEALAVLSEDVAARRETRSAVLRLTRFPADSFLKSDGSRRYRSKTGRLDYSAKIAPDDPVPALLPLFTEGLEGIRPLESPTLGDWLEETQAEAMAGSLTHWLWEESTYLRNRSRPDALLAPIDPDLPPYLDFLTEGDAAGISPHPLFCHHAYRTLNSFEATTELPAFRHFVTTGFSNGFRTSALFDPDFYLAHCPWARDQILNGHYGSALEHFIKVGMSAGFAFSPDFDRAFYLSTYPDVAPMVAEGVMPSAEWHYVFHGVREGRAPNPFFDPAYYLSRYPLIRDEMDRLGIATTLEHFLLLGRDRGWRVNVPMLERSVSADDGRALFEKRGRRAFGDIMDGALMVPDAEAPRLSVVVPVSGQADFTAGFLKAATFAMEILRARRGAETEIIVVDNGSSDATSELISALPAVRLVRFENPIGFPAAVNAGVKAARGDLVLIANNDIEFSPDVFDRLVALLDDDPRVGVVGARVLLPNETLQEVGAMIDRLANPHGLGRGLEATSVRGLRQIEVDYVSGCFMAFHRDDFDQLGGFDEAFSPGYYEDVDFCLRMKRDMGKKTVADTGLTVTHFEHASFARGRPPSVNAAVTLRNRQRLKVSHAAFFRTAGDGRVSQQAEWLRRALSGPTRVLMVTETLPAAWTGAGPGRVEAILDALTRLGIGFDLLILTPGARIDRYKDDRVPIFRAWMPGQSLDDVLREHAGRYSHVWIGGVATVGRHAAALATARADVDLKVICDVEALASQQAVARMRLQGQGPTDEIVWSLAAAELADRLEVDVWVTANPRDRALIEGNGLGPVVDLGYAPRPVGAVPAGPAFEDRHRILFVGNVPSRASPEHDGLEWLLTDVWPYLQDLADVPLTVAGTWPAALARAFRQNFGDRIDFVGDVDEADLARLYGETRVLVVPDRFGPARSAGTFNAPSAGLPSVTTHHVAGQLTLAGSFMPEDQPSADLELSFQQALVRLYIDGPSWITQVRAQQKDLMDQASPELNKQRIQAILALEP